MRLLFLAPKGTEHHDLLIPIQAAHQNEMMSPPGTE